MATEVLKGTLDWNSENSENESIPKKVQIQKKRFDIAGLNKHRIPTIRLNTIHLPKYSRVSF